jgi:hypothetical protein
MSSVTCFCIIIYPCTSLFLLHLVLFVIKLNASLDYTNKLPHYDIIGSLTADRTARNHNIGSQQVFFMFQWQFLYDAVWFESKMMSGLEQVGTLSLVLTE